MLGVGALWCLAVLLAEASAFAPPLSGRVGVTSRALLNNAIPRAAPMQRAARSTFGTFGLKMKELEEAAAEPTTIQQSSNSALSELGSKLVAAEDGAVGQEQFIFTKQWYPVAVVEFLDKKKPHHIQLMGKDLVTWLDITTDTWSVFEDACPHRLAPLSEGRIEPDGTLLCTYHAWRFNAKGTCTSMPHARKENEADLCALPRACAIPHPVQEAQGLLWVWGEPGAPGSDVALEAALKQPAVIPELEDPALGKRAKRLAWSIRDMPYGWDFFMENVLDPAHVSVSHHGITGNRYTSPAFFDLATVRKSTAQGGFKQRVIPETPSSAGTQNFVEFKPPSLVHIATEYPSGGKFVLALFASPTRPGWVRHIGCQVLVEGEDGKLPPGLGFFALPLPVWLLHVTASLFLHQDMVFLHHQEKILARRGYQNAAGSDSEYLQHVFTPTPQDKGVIAFRRWLQFSAGGGVPWAPGSPPLPPRETRKDMLFDVYNTHTKNCAVCLRALRNLKRVRNALFAASFLAVGLSHGVVAVGCGAVLAGLGALVHKLTRLFYAYEFEHAFND